MNDSTHQLLTELLTEQRKTNALLLEVIEATKQARFGGKAQEQYDIVITTYDHTGQITDGSPDVGFILEFKLRFAKDNPEKAAANKELKSLIQKTITAGLGENKHYTISKETKTNKEGTKSWQEWKFVFAAHYAVAIGLRIEAAVKEHGAKVKGLDDLATLAQRVAQVELAAPRTTVATNGDDSETAKRNLFRVGANWARWCNPDKGDFEARRKAIAKEWYGVDSFTQLSIAQMREMAIRLQRFTVKEIAKAQHGENWKNQLPFDSAMILALQGDVRPALEDLTAQQLDTLIDMMGTRLREKQAHTDRRL